MSEDTTKLDNVIQIDEAQVRGHLSELVRGSVEETVVSTVFRTLIVGLGPKRSSARLGCDSELFQHSRRLAVSAR